MTIKNKYKSEKKIKYQKCNFFKTSRNVLPSSRPVDGVNKTSSLLAKPVDLAGLVSIDGKWHSHNKPVGWITFEGCVWPFVEQVELYFTYLRILLRRLRMYVRTHTLFDEVKDDIIQNIKNKYN